MKLNSAQIEQTLHQVEAEAIPMDHPLIPQLERLYGEHTYFLGHNGLNIVEPAESEQKNGRMGVVVNLANWTDASSPRLKPHQPEPTDVIVALGTEDSSET